MAGETIHHPGSDRPAIDSQTDYLYSSPSETRSMGRYSLGQLGRGIAHPSLFLRECNRLYHRRLNRRSYNTSGVDVVAEDWDTMILLDACRYDMFERLHDLPGTLESRISRGSSTREWLHGNFQGRELGDTVYVTAHAQLYRNNDWINAKFHEVVDVWAAGGWDDEIGTVLPETMVEYAREALAEYGDKRHLIHFIQPHVPFIADGGTESNSDIGNRDPDQLPIWRELMEGRSTHTRTEIWELYEQNLEVALPAVQGLLDAIEGRTVVTADHGNMVGDRARPVPIREWGHPRGVYTDELVTIPWLVYESGDRRSITEGDLRDVDEHEASLVEERLADLGYV